MYFHCSLSEEAGLPTTTAASLFSLTSRPKERAKDGEGPLLAALHGRNQDCTSDKRSHYYLDLGIRMTETSSREESRLLMTSHGGISYGR